MTEPCQLVLQIYRAARETPVDEFQDLALELLKAVIPFASSRWITVELRGKAAVTRAIHLQNEPQDIVLDWDAINRQDSFKDILISHPGRAWSIHTSTFFGHRDKAEMLDYVQRYRHGNSLGIALAAPVANHFDAITLFRAKDSHHYAEDERQWLELLMPHLAEALEHNRLFGLQQAGLSTAQNRSATAIARADGLVSYASDAFIHLLQSEWPDVRTFARLPRPLHESLLRVGSAGFSGKTLNVSVARLGELMFLRAQVCPPVTQLSPREAAVAALYSRGYSYKEIARQLDIAPATVRNFLQRIYAKLDIDNKAELATLLAQPQSPTEAN